MIIPKSATTSFIIKAERRKRIAAAMEIRNIMKKCASCISILTFLQFYFINKVNKISRILRRERERV